MKKLILIGLFVTSFCFVNAQIEQNDSIKSKAEEKEFTDPIYGTPIPNPKKSLSSAANKKGSVSLEFGVGLGTKASIDDDYSVKAGFGINPRININISENLSLVPGFLYFFPDPPSRVIDVSYGQLNFDIHYNFSEETSFYVIAGLNLSYGEATGEIVGIEIAVEDDEIGANLGVGIKSSEFPIFGEIKYDTAFDQITFSLGISLPLVDRRSSQIPDDDIYF